MRSVVSWQPRGVARLRKGAMTPGGYHGEDVETEEGKGFLERELSKKRSVHRARERHKAEKQGFDEIARKAGITKGSKDPEPDMQEKAA
jgi:hypothetical protein